METGIQNKSVVVIRREDLYEQVWETPLIRLAASYGVSSKELSQICSRFRIPCPSVGYWANKRFGKSVEKHELSPCEDPALAEATIIPKPRLLPSTEDVELKRRFDEAKAQFAGLSVPAKLSRPHPLIERWLAAHAKKKAESRYVKDLSSTDERRFRFLDALFKTAESIGYTVETDKFEVPHLAFSGSPLEFRLRERRKQVSRPIKEARQRAFIRELQPTGELIFNIDTRLPSALPSEWRDDAEPPLEWKLEEIAAVLTLAGPILLDQFHQRMQAQQRRWEEEQRVREELRLKMQDELRWKYVVGLARKHDEIESVRRFLAAIGKRAQPSERFGDRDASGWMAWMQRWIETEDPLSHPTESVYKSIADIRT